MIVMTNMSHIIWMKIQIFSCRFDIYVIHDYRTDESIKTLLITIS